MLNLTAARTALTKANIPFSEEQFLRGFQGTRLVITGWKEAKKAEKLIKPAMGFSRLKYDMWAVEYF